MSGRVGSITTDIVVDGLVFNMDAANRASTNPSATETINTVDTSISGSFINDTLFSEENGIKSFSFDGTDDRIALSDTSIYSDLGANTTCNIWVKFDNTTAAVLIGGSNFSTGGYFFYASPSSAYSSYKGSFANRSWSSFGTGNWINYCVTKNDSGNVIWYGNGQQVGTGTVTAGNSIGFWSIGAYSGNNFELNGNIASIQVYTRVLTSTEVLHNYNSLKGRFGL